MLDDEEDIVKYYELYRAQEEHENELLHQRSTQLITIQSVLLATFGFSFQKFFEIYINNWSIATKSPELLRLTLFFVLVLFSLCAVGIANSINAQTSIKAADESQQSIRENWSKVRTAYENSGKTHRLPPFAGGGEVRNMNLGKTFHASLPKFFLIFWLVTISFIVVIIIIYILLAKFDISIKIK